MNSVAEKIFEYCIKYENNFLEIPNPKVSGSYKNKRDLFIRYFDAKEYSDAASVFSNYCSIAREKFVWKCFKERLLPKDKFSDLLQVVYTSANIGSGFTAFLNTKQILSLFEYSEKGHLMSKNDFTYWENLPENLVVYRGRSFYQNSTGDILEGISWTLNRKVAKRFAEYHIKDHSSSYRFIAKGLINKRFVYAYFNERKEFEIICDPTKVHVEKITKLNVGHKSKT